MAGFDCLYERDYEDRQIATIAAAEKRVVLTRDILLLKRKVLPWGYWLRSQMPEEQLNEVLTHFGLGDQLQPFSRCLVCNGTVQPVEKELIIDQLEPLTTAYFDQFYRCASCQRIYWQGSHFHRMKKLMQLLAK